MPGLVELDEKICRQNSRAVFFISHVSGNDVPRSAVPGPLFLLFLSKKGYMPPWNAEPWNNSFRSSYSIINAARSISVQFFIDPCRNIIKPPLLKSGLGVWGIGRLVQSTPISRGLDYSCGAALSPTNFRTLNHLGQTFQIRS